MGTEGNGVDRGTPQQGEFPGLPPRLYVASPSKLLAFLDCPRRFHLTYLARPAPPKPPPRAHTSYGLSVHNALRDWWDLPLTDRTPAAGARLLRECWIRAGFPDDASSQRWRAIAAGEVERYLGGVEPTRHPWGVERTAAFRSGELAMTGRIDRVDDRDGEPVVVDYKTSRSGLHPDAARTSLALGLYAAAVWKMARRRCVRVELHHLPSGEVVAHEHSDASLTRKVEQARAIAVDARQAEARLAAGEPVDRVFPPQPSPLCRWCDLREHCPEGAAVGPAAGPLDALDGREPRPDAVEAD